MGGGASKKNQVERKAENLEETRAEKIVPIPSQLTEAEFPWEGHLAKISSDLFPLIRSYYVSNLANRPYKETHNFGGHGNAEDKFDYVQSAVLDQCGNLYCVDWNNFKIKIFDSEGKYTRSIQTGKCPCAVAFLKGDLVVLEYTNPRVVIYHIDGSEKRKWGQRGISPGCFSGPRGIAVTPDARIVVPDPGLHRFTIFDELGGVLKIVGTKDILPHSNAVGVHPKTGHFVFSDELKNRIVIYNSNGDFERIIEGTFEPERIGRLNGPWGVAVSAAGHIFIADRHNHQISIFDWSGHYLNAIHEPGMFKTPLGVTIDEDLNVYVADTSNHTVRIFK